MNNKEKLRRLNHLMYKNYILSWAFENIKKTMLELESVRLSNTYVPRYHKEYLEIFKIAEELEVSDESLYQLWMVKCKLRDERRQEYSNTCLKEGRDNKDVLVGRGGSNRNKIRYPSKKRSIKTWKKFYKLFPWAAIADGFDGKTSKRMK